MADKEREEPTTPQPERRPEGAPPSRPKPLDGEEPGNVPIPPKTPPPPGGGG